MTYDTEIDYQKLKNMAILLNQKKVDYIATHSDVFCPNELGNIPDIGSFIALMKATNNKEPDIILGKPNTVLIENIIKKYDSEKNSCCQ